MKPDRPRNLRTFCPNNVRGRGRVDIDKTITNIDDESMDYQSSSRRDISDQAASANKQWRSDLEGARVLILTGSFKGEEGMCLGRHGTDNSWAVSPNNTPEILSLVFERDFALLVDLSSDPNRN